MTETERSKNAVCDISLINRFLADLKTFPSPTPPLPGETTFLRSPGALPPALRMHSRRRNILLNVQLGYAFIPRRAATHYLFQYFATENLFIETPRNL